jgi:hypothetical protein
MTKMMNQYQCLSGFFCEQNKVATVSKVLKTNMSKTHLGLGCDREPEVFQLWRIHLQYEPQLEIHLEASVANLT